MDFSHSALLSFAAEVHWMEVLSAAVEWVLLSMAGLSLLMYVGPIGLTCLLPPRNLRKTYGAQWAVVTGGTSGIGRALVDQLAAQHINMVVVAHDKEALKTLHETFALTYPTLTIRTVDVDLGHPEAIPRIVQATTDISVSLLFNNAGIMLMQAFTASHESLVLKNINTNVLAAVRLTHHFYGRMIAEKHRGAICFTSSQTSFWPSPVSATYAAGKAFLAEFAASLTLEAQQYGVDVLSVHPGLVRTNLFRHLPRLLTLRLLDIVGQEANDVAQVIMRSLGRVVWRDTGLFTLGTRLSQKVLGMNGCIVGMRWIFSVLSEYKQFF